MGDIESAARLHQLHVQGRATRAWSASTSTARTWSGRACRWSQFIREFGECIHCAHVKGVWVAREHCRAGRLGGHRPMGHWANGWNFVTAGTARDANSLEEIFIELNRVGFDGAVSHRVGGQRRRAARRGARRRWPTAARPTCPPSGMRHDEMLKG